MQIRTTKIYNKWITQLRDVRAQARIFGRVARLAEGNSGDSRSVGGGVRELRMDFGPGYRVYYVQRGTVLVLLLCGGDKSSQDRDIVLAKVLAAQMESAEG